MSEKKKYGLHLGASMDYILKATTDFTRQIERLDKSVKILVDKKLDRIK